MKTQRKETNTAKTKKILLFSQYKPCRVRLRTPDQDVAHFCEANGNQRGLVDKNNHRMLCFTQLHITRGGNNSC